MELAEAAARSDHVAVAALLAQGIDVNSKDADGRTALSRAAEVQDITTMDLLLNHAGVDLNSTDKHGRTPLWWAASSYNIEAAQLLLRQRGIDENAKGDCCRCEPPWAMALKFATVSERALSMAELLLCSDGVEFVWNDKTWQYGFLSTAEAGLENLCRILLGKRGVDPNVTNIFGDTALHLAVTKRHPSIIQLLLSHPGINVNAKNRNDESGLLLATRMGQKPIAELLLTHRDIDVNLGDMQVRTPLSRAATVRSKTNGILQLLLQRTDVNLSLADHDGRTPLSWAAGNGLTRVVELLVAKIAPPDISGEQSELIQSNDGSRVSISSSVSSLSFYHFCSTSHCSCSTLRTVSNGATGKVELSKLDQADKSGQTPLSWAAKNGREAVMELLLLKKGVDPASADADGRTPLSWAAGNGHAGAVKQLLQRRGIKQKSRDAIGRTPLSWAAGNGCETVVDLLLSETDLHSASADADGRTPFSWAAGNGQYSVTRLFLAKNLKAEVKDINGRSPFSWAAGNGHHSIVSLLVETKVTADEKDDSGRTPLSWAAGNGHNSVVKRLRHNETVLNDSADFYNRTPLSWAAGNGHSEVVKVLLLHTANDTRGYHDSNHVMINLRDNHGRTPLSWAAGNGCVEIVEQLHEAGAQMDARDADDRTPLSWAAGHGHESVVAKLLPLHMDVDVNATDHDGISPLLHAVKHGHTAVVRQLLGRDDIRPMVADVLGQAALHYAVTSSQTGMVSELLAHRGVPVSARDTSGITPLRKAVQHKVTDSIQRLLRSSASTEGIMRDQWLAAFREPASHTVVLSEVAGGGTNISFIAEEALPTALSSSAQTQRLFLCGGFSPWDKQLIPNSLRGNDGVVDWRTKRPTGSNAVTSFAAQTPRISQSQEYLELEWCRCAIAWDMAPQSNRAVSLNYFSMLPDSAFPKSAATLFEQLLCHVRETWLQVCDECELYLADRRRYQLQEKGESARFVQDLARDAQVWSSLRYHLRDHVHDMKEFTTGHLRFSGIEHNEARILAVIAEFEAVAHERMNSLDQTLRDLLQFEFAWVSINEARRSIDLAASMKRLTWITFIFLPLMFSSSLFGMNVDLLKDNPNWRWYALFAAGSLVLTTCGWLLVRLNPLKRTSKRKSSYEVPEAESQTTLPR